MAEIDLVIYIVANLGVVAGAVSGVFEARRKDMDVVGASTVALITALGGGTLRDMLLGRAPVFWIIDPTYPILGFVVALLTFYSTRLLSLTSRSILVPDALALGVFTVVGTAIAVQQGVAIFVAVMMGVITGVFGGVLRDVICNEIPNIFVKSTQLYATCSFVGGWVYIFMLTHGFYMWAASLGGILVTFVMRLAAVRWNWKLPEPRSRV